MSSWSHCGFLISIPNLILRWYVNKYYWDMKDFYKFLFQIWEEWLTVFNKCMSCMLSCFSSVQFSRTAVSDSLRPHESQHTRPPCPSPTPRVHANPCPSIQWCHPAISSSVVPFSSCPQSFPALGSFPRSQLFSWGGQRIEVSASTSVLPMNIQD